MRRGAWHQFGDRSQLLVLEQLDHGQSVGVIISPRDLAPHLAKQYADQYHDKGAHVLIDQQFFVPDSVVGKLPEYEISKYRGSASGLRRISDSDAAGLSAELERLHSDIKAEGLIAPGLVYQAGRPDIVDVNSKLFRAAKAAGDKLGIPTYATIVLGLSATDSDHTMNEVISHATALNCDGWYFAFEFDEPRVPANEEAVRRACEAGLSLACTGRPMLHAYAGPLGLLSLGFGSTGVGIGHSQNLWQFTVDRWYPSSGLGGGGDAPPRFFSSALWGTIVYADELAPLPQPLRETLVTHSPFSDPVKTSPPYLPWSRWDANKHLVYKICEQVTELASASTNARDNVRAAATVLDGAIALHEQIADEGAALSDNTAGYQQPWRRVIDAMMTDRADDYDYLDML